MTLANATKMCYTYDELSRVTSCTAMSLCGEVLHTECFTYDAASNVTDCATDCCMQYDAQNRLTVYDGNAVSYDMDGNMLSHGSSKLAYDSANRLISAGQNAYTYNAEDVRIRNLCDGVETTYTYDTNCKLSRMLTKTTNGVTTKYVYGRGLIGEETNRQFKTYHFDFRGSTLAITNGSGNITDTFIYDTYGKLMARTGTTPVIFGYNGRDGVVTDANGLIYMRARYYSPDMRRFINADIVAGNISNAVTLNRYAYANGNPVSNIDPFGLSAERGLTDGEYKQAVDVLNNLFSVTLENELWSGNGYSVPIGSTEYYAKVNHTVGEGDIDINKFVKGQVELAASTDMLLGNFEKTFDSELSWKAKYSVQIDEYNTVSASLQFNADMSFSAEYSIASNVGKGLSVETVLGVKHRPNTNNNSTSINAQRKKESKPQTSKQGAVIADYAMAIVVTVVAVMAVANTVITAGAAFADDIAAIGAAISAWGRAFGLC